MPRFILFLFLNFFSISTKYIIYFSNNSLSKEARDLISSELENIPYAELKERIQNIKTIYKWSISKRGQLYKLILFPERPLAKINNNHILTSSGKFIHCDQFDSENLNKIQASAAINPEEILKFIKNSNDMLLNEYSINIQNKNLIELKDLKNENRIIECSYKTQNLKHLLDSANYICNNISSRSIKKKPQKIRADLRFKGQIIIHLLD